MAEALELNDDVVPARSNAKWWWLGVVFLIILGFGVFGALYGAGVFGAKESATNKTQRREALYVSVEPPFTVNFSGGGRARYLQVGMDIMTRDPDVRDQLDRHMPVIRNDLVLLLSSKTAEDLSTIEGKEDLQQETLSAVRRVIEDETKLTGVEAVYFTSFVMQ